MKGQEVCTLVNPMKFIDDRTFMRVIEQSFSLSHLQSRPEKVISDSCC